MVLSDRSPADALPALLSLGVDLKTEPLGPDSLTHLPDLGPSAIVMDAVIDPELAYGLLSALAASRITVPVLVLVEPSKLEAFPWHQAADELVYASDPATVLRVRLAMLIRRTGGADDATIRLGPLSINTDTYQVMVEGRVLDLTYKEFELLRFLVQRPGRVFTRGSLLQEVWGYNFYGGSRTVDVHVRRLRAKLGSEHESLIETVRGVGYRAADPWGGGPAGSE